jgi:hypothetical protein
MAKSETSAQFRKNQSWKSAIDLIDMKEQDNTLENNSSDSDSDCIIIS